MIELICTAYQLDVDMIMFSIFILSAVFHLAVGRHLIATEE